MSTLYEITGDYLRLLEMLEEDENLDPQAFADTLEGIEGEFEIKADGYARVLKELTSEAGKYDVEIQRMTARRDSLNNRSKMLKQHLYESMKATGKLKFRTDLFSFGIQKNGGLQPVEIVPDVSVPLEYCRVSRTIPKSGKHLKMAQNCPLRC